MRSITGWCQVLSLVFVLLHFHVKFSPCLCSSPPPPSHSGQLCSPSESTALLVFKDTLSVEEYPSFQCGRTSYPKTNSWNKSTDCCLWDGVMCDRMTGHVIGLELSCSRLKGTIHANNSLFLLTSLQRLNLAANDFGESFSPRYNASEIASFHFGQLLHMTHLNLSYSRFSGIVPHEISLLSKLVSLDLSYNQLTIDQRTFDMLAHNLTRLRRLVLNVLNMSSVAPLSLLNLTSSLTSLSISWSSLQGNLPYDFFRFPYLQDLVLSGNRNLTAYLPKSNWSSSLIRLLDLSYTSFSQELPYSIRNLELLEELKLKDCNLNGLIPVSLGNLTKLTLLDLSENHLSGQIPDVFYHLNQLTSLDLSSNNLSGQLPLSVFSLTELSVLDFQSNQLDGHLPYQISGLSNLTELHLSNNLLNGRVPSWLFTLPSLQLIYFKNNKLTGPIDQSEKPNSVKQVYLQNNAIQGPIPDSVFELVNLTFLDLSSNNLSGIIEYGLFSNLRNLEWIDLSYNRLLSVSSSGGDINTTLPKLQTLGFSSCNIREFPSFFRTLENLENLDLSYNNIHGRISKWETEGWQSLFSMNLSYNSLTGLEQFPGKTFTIFDISSNLIRGPLPAPPPRTQILLARNNNLTGEITDWICNLSSLSVLDLSNNSLSGVIPKCLGNLSNYLSVIDLHMNQFHGIIQMTFMEGNSLRNLDLNSNLLEGPLPQSLVNCSKLEVLDVGNNRINDTFPYLLQTLPELQILVLRSNRFYGPIQNLETQFPFPKLRVIDLSYNEFSGILPTNFLEKLNAMVAADGNQSELKYMGSPYYQDSVIVTIKGLEVELVRILTIFTTIDFSSNSFGGQIPEEVGKLKSLRLLNFSHNSLTGHIPSSLGNLTALESLDLSSNEFVGEIPIELMSLTFLAVLNLSYNQLVGLIPRGRQFDTFGNSSYIGNLGLCGDPLTEKCSTDQETQQPPPSIFHEEDSFSEGFDWKIVMTGYGCGLVIGLSTIYIVFSTGKPWWFIKMIEQVQYKIRRGIRN